jgi:hypothetical protein
MGKPFHSVALIPVLALFGCAGAKVSGNGQNNDGGQRDGGPAVCDPFSNSGCPSDKKCTALQKSGGALALGCDSRGSKTEGATCTPTIVGSAQTGDDCGDSLSCFSIQGDPAPTCHRFCDAANACPSGSICALPVGNLVFCRPSCLPLQAASGCVSGQGCYSIENGAICMTAGSKKPGDTCTAANDCQPGSTCVRDASGHTSCASFCSTATGGTPPCSSSTGGATCTPLPGTLPEPNAGVCR